MIRHVNLKNFKAWRELDIEFGPRITGLFGTNSSGKSSLIQFLLMLKETKNNPDRNIVLDFGKSGGVINLGGFGDVIHRNDKNKNWNGGCPGTAWDSLGTHPTLTRAKMRFNSIIKNVSIQSVVGMANPRRIQIPENTVHSATPS